MRRRKLFVLTMILILVFPTTLIHAKNDDGEVKSKEEVVYATLGAEGLLQDIYVVNILDITKPGQITDHGNYTSVKNLTTVTPIDQNKQTIAIKASEEGEFYYQGNMKDQALPWHVQIDYRLDGQKINPNQLAGKSGHLKVKIKTSKNEAINKTFFENYLLQISMTAGSEVFKHVQATEGTIANAGEDLVINWTVMPEKNSDLTLEADVTNFEMKGFEIAALPSSMPIEAPDTKALTSDFQSLHDAIKEINSGVSELSNGISDLSNGASDLNSGSTSFQRAATKAANSSESLIQASNTISQSLNKMNQSVEDGVATPDFSQLGTLQQGLNEMANGLENAANQLTELSNGYTEVTQGLDQVMQSLPSTPESEEELQKKIAEMQAVVNSFSDDDLNKKVAKEMMTTYQAAIQVKGAYMQDLKPSFEQIGSSLEQADSPLTVLGGNLSKIASELGTTLESIDIGDSFTELEQGLNQLTSSYDDFHTGLVEYTDGIDQIATSYNNVDKGIDEVANGTDELATGANKLDDGTEALETSTAQLPNEIKNEINAMLEQYDKSDYDPVSFVSTKNTNVERVQFVIRTESIEQQKMGKETEKTEQKEEQKSFWDKLVDLFK
ncbi:YhgE/Pip domain-containing protein [Paraliobacillus sp. JSM ZJ581]|uniref:YhgE/Pip domain-containing protein n=1 Tax=Paraliobacillus sp. JSM ZJ581 TaxID=3342118 RepID=UPI0035A90714